MVNIFMKYFKVQFFLYISRKDRKWYEDISFKVHFSIVMTTMMIAKGIALWRVSQATKPPISLLAIICSGL